MPKVFVIIDGLADRPCKILNGQTPLEAAYTPHLDYFAKRGKNGFVQTVKDGLAPESDEAVVALLGNDVEENYGGRGPLEAYGTDLEYQNGDLALRVNFSTVVDKKLIDRRVGRTLLTKEAKVLEKAINDGVKLDHDFIFKATIGHRGILVFKNGKYSSNISNVDPAYKKVGHFGVAVEGGGNELLPSKSLDPKKETKDSARLVNEFVKQSHQILKNHPLNAQREKRYLLKANILVPRDAGVKLGKFEKRLNWCAVVAMPLEIGIARASGMKVVKFVYPESRNTNMYKQLHKGLKKTISVSKKAFKECGEHTKYYIHFKEIDVAGHDNKPLEKKKMLEVLDKEFFKFLRGVKNLELVVTADHSTPCELRGHSADPVPLLYYKEDLVPDAVETFSERECQHGSLGKMYGKDTLRSLRFV